MISFTKPQHALLKREAKRLGVSVAELVRRCVDASLASIVRIAVVCFLSTLGIACSNPLSPSVDRIPSELFVPPVLQPVMDAIDGEQWIHPLIAEPSGQWLRRHVRAVIMDDRLSASATVVARFNMSSRVVEWNPLFTPDHYNVTYLAAIMLHEARHGQNYMHSCGNFLLAGDRTMEEGGAFAVQILYLEHHQRFFDADDLRANFIGCR